MKTRRDFLKLAGASLVGISGAVSAEKSPFGFAKMDSGYTQVAMEGKCGEGKCGGKSESKSSEGKCGEGKCGGKSESKSSEGKCGEGKCGGSKS